MANNVRSAPVEAEAASKLAAAGSKKLAISGLGASPASAALMPLAVSATPLQKTSSYFLDWINYVMD